MVTTLKDQISSIRIARNLAKGLNDEVLDQRLNDAGATLASLKMIKEVFDKAEDEEKLKIAKEFLSQI